MYCQLLWHGKRGMATNILMFQMWGVTTVMNWSSIYYVIILCCLKPLLSGLVKVLIVPAHRHHRIESNDIDTSVQVQESFI